MSESALDVVRRLHDAANAGDMPGAMELYDPGVELVVGGSYPAPGLYEGRERVGRWFGEYYGGVFRRWRADLVGLEEVDDVVVADIHFTGEGRTSGIELEARGANLYRVANGRIVWVSVHQTREGALGSIGADAGSTE